MASPAVNAPNGNMGAVTVTKAARAAVILSIVIFPAYPARPLPAASGVMSVALALKALGFIRKCL